ncbi:hypothetical protein TRFO_18501 [Tritrichomonas foetus]|uniref:Uncharacterized protein n=1 Tax=Tritrichomonas foetus TaxID=1144522 RepID=A0A1J4KKT2_9EUKA|nr:hypothetical protein TRFO_18501 [Tritrichomonas foetus]|eukprot:OHT11913.1 hypothetical protein TRFO_18501 [Tritrichomonas foetus]
MTNILSFKEPNGSKHQLNSLNLKTIRDARGMLTEKLKMDKDKIILIYKGRVLEDRELIKNLSLKDNNYIICNVITKPPSAEFIKAPTSNPLPEGQKTQQTPVQSTQNKLPTNDQDDIESKVLLLIEMGFQRADCEKVLKSQKYDVEAAANFLLTTSAK